MILIEGKRKTTKTRGNNRPDPIGAAHRGRKRKEGGYERVHEKRIDRRSGEKGGGKRSEEKGALIVLVPMRRKRGKGGKSPFPRFRRSRMYRRLGGRGGCGVWRKKGSAGRQGGERRERGPSNFPAKGAFLWAQHLRQRGGGKSGEGVGAAVHAGGERGRGGRFITSFGKGKAPRNSKPKKGFFQSLRSVR